MDMSEITRAPSALAEAQALRSSRSATTVERWHALVAQMGAEIAAPLTAALERIDTLTSTGKIDRAALRALREEVEAARQAGKIGQQLTRFAAGRIRQSHERLQLADMLGGVIAQRSRESAAPDITLRSSPSPAEVIGDASLLFGLLNATVDWALANAQSQIGFEIDVRKSATQARLICLFAHREIGAATNGEAASAARRLDSLTWRLLEQTAWTMGLVIEREDAPRRTTLTLEFPLPASHALEGASEFELNDGFAASINSQPLAGSHVLVIASRREMRVLVRDALRNMSLIVDFVNSVEEAAKFCREGLPHAVVIESIQTGERFALFRKDILREVPDFVFIEIIEEGKTFEMSGFNGSQIARVGRDVLAESLPSALMFELSKNL